MPEGEPEHERLREWSRQLAESLGVPDVGADLPAILDLAGLAARTVVRPAAPLTTFVVGYAAGLRVAQGALGADVAIRSATDVAVRLCRDRRPDPH